MDATIHRDVEPDGPLISEAVETFRLLADETRMRLLAILLGTECTVGQLAHRLDKPLPAVSQHLARLRTARIVQTRRQGTHIHYRLENDHVAQLVIDVLRHAEHAESGPPRHHSQDVTLLAGAGRAGAVGATGTNR